MPSSDAVYKAFKSITREIADVIKQYEDMFNKFLTSTKAPLENMQALGEELGEAEKKARGYAGQVDIASSLREAQLDTTVSERAAEVPEHGRPEPHA